MTWAEMEIKYSNWRDGLTESEHKQYILDCYKAYEDDDMFAKTFWSPYGPEEKFGMKIKSIIPIDVNTKDFDLETLPVWYVTLEDGYDFYGFPEEIVVSERRNNGCPGIYL